jgi:superfamily II DNA/RNA helicase
LSFWFIDSQDGNCRTILSKGTPAKSNQVRTLILTPTRELAAQVNASVIDYGKCSSHNVFAI